MGSVDVKEELLGIYDLASSGRHDAFQFLRLWHEWCHLIDDHMDAGKAHLEAVDLCADAAVLFAETFFHDHKECLLPVVAVTAEKYRTSCLEPELDFLRIAGNDMILTVAAICGGRALVRLVSDRLWPVVLKTQFP